MNTIKTFKIVATALTAASLVLHARADITTGLVGYWTMSDGSPSSTAADSSTYLDTATLTGFSDGTYTSMWVPGYRGGVSEGNAIIFNQASDTGDYLSIPYQSQLTFDTGLQFTISAWVKSSGSQVAGAGVIDHGAGGAQQYTLDVNANVFRFYVYSSSGAHVLNATVGPVAGTWIHVVGVFNASSTGTKQQIIYINGVQNASATPPTSIIASPTIVSIGNRQSGTTTFNLPFKGTIDEVRIYNRALAATDVEELYAYGSTTPPTIVALNPVNCYVGDSPSFSTTATSSLPISSYQWQFDGTNIAGATSSSLILTDVQLANSGTYTVIASTGANSTLLSATNSTTLTVTTPPPANTTSGLVGWWKFNDGSGSSTAADSSGNNNTGTLTGFVDTSYTTMWTNGLFNGALDFNLDSTKLNVVAVPSVGTPAPAVLDFSATGATTTPVFTLAAWVNGALTQTSGGGIIAKGTGGGGEQYVVDVNLGVYRFYVRDTNAITYVAQSSVKPNAIWQHVAAVLNGTNGIMNLYVNGLLVAAAAAPVSLLSNSHEMTIGNRQASTGAYGNDFTGLIEDVRVYNRALSSVDVYALYLLGGAFPPSFSTQPQSASLYLGDNLKLSPAVAGTAPLTYQWKKNTAIIPGATNSSLTFVPLAATNAGTYVLNVTNIYGATNSAPAIITVSPFALTNALAAWWKFDDGAGSCTAADSSPNGNNGNLVNFPDCTSEWVTGLLGDAIAFNTNSINEYVDVPYAPSLDFNTNLVFTLSAWVNGSVTQIPSAGILCKGFGNDNEEYCMDYEDNLYRFYVRNAAGVVSVLYAPAVDVPSGTWQLLTATFDGNFGLMTYYVNGQPVATNTAAPNSLLGENDHDVSIGCRESSIYSGYNLSFAGVIDDVRIYNRALSANDVQTLYQAVGLTAPTFDTQPQGATNYSGTSLTLSAAVDGTTPLSYQWLLNSNAIAGATNSSLTLASLTPANSGAYTLEVTNGSGTNFSQPAVVLVLPVNFTSATFLSNGTVQLSFTGQPNASFTLYSTANLALPLIQWTVVENGSFDGNGNAVVIDANAPNNPAQYYYMQTQVQ